MTRKIAVIIALVCLTGCSVRRSIDATQQASVQFIRDMVAGHYEACLRMADTDNISRDSLVAYFDAMRYRVNSEFWKDVSYTPGGYNETITFFAAQQENPAMISSYVQIADKNRFSIFQLTWTGNHKISGIGMANTIYPVPNLRLFWIVGILLALLVLGFNIYVIIRVYKSDVVRKWLKYLIIVLLNIPVIGYHAIGGVFFKLLSFQLLGIGFSADNYLNTYWAIGVPLGAIIVLWRLKASLYRTKDDDTFYTTAAPEEHP